MHLVAIANPLPMTDIAKTREDPPLTPEESFFPVVNLRKALVQGKGRYVRIERSVT